MTKQQLSALRARGVAVPDGWRVTTFSSNPHGDWTIEVAGKVDGQERKAQGNGWTIAEAMDALKWTLANALLSDEQRDRLMTQQDALAEQLRQRQLEAEAANEELARRRQLCPACAEGEHAFCSGCPCPRLYPGTAMQHP